MSLTINEEIALLNNRTSRDLQSDFANVIANLATVESASIVLPILNSQYQSIVTCYVAQVKKLKEQAIVKRYTRYPYDKAYDSIYNVVFNPEYDDERLRCVIDPLKDFMALSVIKQAPVEIVLPLMHYLDEFMGVIDNMIKLDAADQGLAAQPLHALLDTQYQTLLDDIVTVTDTFYDLRVLHIL